MKQDFGLDELPPPLPTRPGIGLPRLIFAVAVIGVLLGFFLSPTVTRCNWPRARQFQCVNNLKQIGLALRAYRDAHGEYPPAVVADASGRPTQSWRALILPYLDSWGPTVAYDPGQPWDAPGNRAAVATSIGPYRCPTDAGLAPGITSYVLIRGPRTAFPDGGPGRATVRDDPSETILVAEVAGSNIPWAEPRDLDIRRMAFRINDPANPCLSSRHDSGANVVMIDGSARRLRGDLPPAVIRALITVDGGEVVAAEALDR